MALAMSAGEVILHSENIFAKMLIDVSSLLGTERNILFNFYPCRNSKRPSNSTGSYPLSFAVEEDEEYFSSSKYFSERRESKNESMKECSAMSG